MRIIAMVKLTPPDDPFGNPTEVHVSARSGEVAVELDGPGFQLVFESPDHLRGWLAQVAADLDELANRQMPGEALLGGEAS